MRQRLWRTRRQPAGRGPHSAVSHVVVVDPGSSLLRVLDVTVGQGPPSRGEHSDSTSPLPAAAREPAAVWGWGEQPPGDQGESTGPLVRVDHASLARELEQGLSAAEIMASDRSAGWQPADALVVGLPAADLRGWSWSIAQRRPQPDRPIEERELEALLGRTLRLVVSHLKQTADVPPTSPDDSEWLLVEADAVALIVDGRGVTDPVGFRGSELGATVFAALAKAEAVDSWRRAADRLGFSALTLTAAPLALAASLSESQCLAVDVGATATSLTWCRAAKPLGTRAFAAGGALLTESLSRRWGMNPERAEALKRAYAAGKLTRQAGVQVQEVLAPMVSAWLALLEEALGAMAEKADEPLPHHLCLCGGGSELAEVAEAIRTLAWSRRLHFARYPQVDMLKTTDVPAVVNHTDLGRGAGDVPILALAAWAARQNQPLGRPGRILRKLSGT